ncbi:MAG: DUF1924 domain-containing protein [Alphaproteobacteria bacterium]|nr:DUF1924 domain-containing protein [Alphaproteobacteria bacterium]
MTRLTFFKPLSRLAVAACVTIVALSAVPAAAGPAQDQILAGLKGEAQAAPGWTGAFSAERGRALLLASPATGKPDTPSCTTCHTDSPLKAGQTRTGKAIAPMALSVTPDRYTDPEKVEKWFGRNCNSVLGRPCTALEKGDFLTFMMGQ